MVNPTMFFDIAIKWSPWPCLLLPLCRQSSKHSRKLSCLSTGGKVFGYKGSCFHKILWDLCARVVTSQAISSKAIYGEEFDENFILKHIGPGIFSMANAGPNTNSCQFLICTAKTEWLEGEHVVFGQVKESMDIVTAIEHWAPGMARAARRSPLLTVDNSNKFDLYFILTTKPFLCSSGEHPSVGMFINLRVLASVHWVPYFPYPVSKSS
ncbi:peptidyl-prolyl cis-trans isomerase A-like [Myotis myotis]|uniref:peptidyl-prolyl cis-trans isomerase A-like n=1 Tax=Myotis myotis TaxID=51298 RepID=UPI00174DFBB1|nr:peptidyl-prolyl cis-trans isomerase A-like [Myotis myotis]